MHGGRDKPTWMLTAGRKFTVKSLYRDLIKSDVGFSMKFLWKTKVPAKIRFFLWLLARKSILTRDNLIKIGWKGDKNCVFYGKDEMIDHLFFSCSVAKTIWAHICQEPHKCVLIFMAVSLFLCHNSLIYTLLFIEASKPVWCSGIRLPWNLPPMKLLNWARKNWLLLRLLRRRSRNMKVRPFVRMHYSCLFTSGVKL